MNAFGDFKVMNVNWGQNTHSLLMKRHNGKVPIGCNVDIPSQATLFLLNVPLSTFHSLIPSLSCIFGSIIEKVIIVLPSGMTRELSNMDHQQSNAQSVDHSVIPAGCFFYLVFQEDFQVDQALRLSNTSNWIFSKNGMDRWKSLYQQARPSVDELKAVLNYQITLFDTKEEQKRKELESKTNIPDEDGWVTVTRSQRRNTNNNNGVTVTAASANQTLKPKKEGFVDFYRFQMRQAKREKLEELRANFEADKQKIAELKNRRVFKPY